VLAAAVRGECDVLVTSNVRDCPDQVVEAFDLSVATVDDAIIFVVDSFPDAMAEIVDRLLAPLRNPPMTRDMFTDRLSLRAPMGATVLGAALGIETYVLIRENARDAPNKAGPIVALSRLVDAIEHGRADEVVEMVAPELAEEITGSKSPDRHELCAKLRVLLDDVKLGSVEIGKLRTSDVRAWDAGLLTAGVGPVTVAKAYRLLRAMLNTALQDVLIGKNHRCLLSDRKHCIPGSDARRIALRTTGTHRRPIVS
jgi:hypothetical protein